MRLAAHLGPPFSMVCSTATLALTSLFCRDVGLGLRTIGEKGVSLSSSAVLILDDLTPGVKIDEKSVTSCCRVGWSNGDGRGEKVRAQVLIERKKMLIE